MALEASRQLHEEIETLERAAMVVLDHKPHGAKAKVCKDHVIANLVGAVVERAERLSELADDADGARREEVASMRGGGAFTSFYAALKETREYHARHGDRLQARRARAARRGSLSRFERSTRPRARLSR